MGKPYAMNLRRNSALNLLGSAAPAVAALVFIPGTLSRLGGERFGVLTLMLALIGYFSLFDLGMGRGLTFEISKARREDRLNSDLGKIVLAGTAIILFAGLLGSALVFFASERLAVRLLQVDPAIQADSIGALRIVAMGIVIVTLTSGTRGIMEGLDRFGLANALKAITGLLTFSMPWVAVRVDPVLPLTTTALLLVGGRLAMSFFEVTYIGHLVFRGRPTAKLSVTQISSMFHYGSWILISNTLSPLMNYGDRFVIGRYVGVGVLPLYAIPQEGLQRLLMIPSAVCGALLPKLAAASEEDFPKILSRAIRANNFGMLLICLLAAIVCEPFYSLWIDASFASAATPPTWIMLVGVYFNANAMFKFVALHARGHSRITGMLHILEFVIYFAMLPVVLKTWGLNGAAFMWSMRMVVDNLALTASVRGLQERHRAASATREPR